MIMSSKAISKDTSAALLVAPPEFVEGLKTLLTKWGSPQGWYLGEGKDKTAHLCNAEGSSVAICASPATVFALHLALLLAEEILIENPQVSESDRVLPKAAGPKDPSLN